MLMSRKRLGEYLVLLSFFFLLLSSFCLMPISPFLLPFTLNKPIPNLFLTSWLSLAQLLFYFIFEWNFKPQLGEF